MHFTITIFRSLFTFLFCNQMASAKPATWAAFNMFIDLFLNR